MLSRLFNCLNSLIILFYLNFKIEDLTEKNVLYSDLYYSVCEILGEQKEGLDKDVLIETITPLFDNYIEPLIDKASEITKKESSFLDDSIDIPELSEDAKKLMFTENFIRDCFYENIEDAMYAFDYDTTAPAAEESFKDEEFKNFISYMSEYFSPLPAKLRKNAMRNLLSALPPAMSENELILYIKNAVDSAPSFESKVMILDKVGYVFENNGFELSDEEDGCTCGHHEHDHDCTCGHDH
ncbi:hypothetical protein SDC9_158861 [bioreactor metagenome]|uniref:Uncharacterized protein n=1 Tax=bioreactor metagenome TaxID=1076179 RepID=A0A645FB17_9ZZZZ